MKDFDLFEKPSAVLAGELWLLWEQVQEQQDTVCLLDGEQDCDLHGEQEWERVDSISTIGLSIMGILTGSNNDESGEVGL